MTKPLSSQLKAVLPVLLLVLLVSGGGAIEKAVTASLDKPVPEGLDDLRAIEKAARDVARRVVRCTVGVQVGGRQGSGVIIGQDGYVLTAAHVSEGPGHSADIRLPDGTRLKGKTLGMHTQADLGLIKISEDGTWPFASLVPRGEAPEAGDWCLATGHPHGFETQRPPPVRFGRVIDVRDSVLRTDCPITEGDSGGPLFDMQGRVIGIHSRIAEDVTENLHGNALACVEAWEPLVASLTYPVRPASRFLERLDKNRDGKISRAELPAGPSRRLFDRLAREFELDPTEAHSIKKLTHDFGWKSQTIPVFGQTPGWRERIGQSLRRDRFLRGRQVRGVFYDALAAAQKSTVQIECGGQRVALGTVVAADGWIVTKASQLDGDIRCLLPGGRRLEAVLVGEDDKNDLAILQIDASGLTPVQWAGPFDLEVGSWLIGPGMNRTVASLGVVSVGPRDIVSTAVLGVMINENENEARVIAVAPKSGAAKAGIRSGDVISHIEGKPVHNIDELKGQLRNFGADDVVEATIVRDRKRLRLDVTLGVQAEVFPRFSSFQQNGTSGELSRRRDGFSKVVQHDSVLSPTMCGGPVVDISGQVVGVNIARADRIASFAVGGDAIQPFVDRIRARSASKSPPSDSK